MQLLILARHGESVLNLANAVNGDPGNDPGLSDHGHEQARLLGEMLAGVAIDRAVVSPFPRTIQTATLALEGRGVELEPDEDLGDVRIGELDGSTLVDYRAAPAHSDRDLAFPGGESLNDAARRYGRALSRIADATGQVTLVVTHEVPIRYALNATTGSDSLDRPFHGIANAAPYLIEAGALRRGAARILELAGRSL